MARGVAEEAAGDGRSAMGVGGLWEETWVEGLCKRGWRGRKERGCLSLRASGKVWKNISSCSRTVCWKGERESMEVQVKNRSVISAVTGATYVCLLINPPTLGS